MSRLVAVTPKPGAVVYSPDEDGEPVAYIAGQVFEVPAADAKTLEEQGTVEKVKV